MRPSFLSCADEMAARIGECAVLRRALGPPEAWPPPLRMALRLMLTTRHPAFLFWGPEHLCMYNQAYSALLGPDKHPAILGRPGAEAWAEIWPVIGPEVAQVMAGGEATWHENHLVPILRDGRLVDVWWTYSYSPVDDPDAPGGVAGVLVLCTDTTAHLRRAGALQLAHERLAAATQAAALGIHRWDIVADTIEWDDRVRALWGVGPDERITFDVFMAGVHEDDRGAVASAVERALDPRGDAHYRCDYRVVTRGGPQRWVHATGRVTFDGERPVSMVGTVQDITEDRAIRQALADSDRKKDVFLAMLSHELRNPLAPIRSAVRVLRACGDLPPAHDRTLDVIERQTAHMGVLLDDLLDASRIGQGKLVLERRVLALREVVEDAVEVVRPLAEARGQRLVADLPPPTLRVVGDPVRLTQVLSNLLTNASKFTNAGGRLAVEVGPPTAGEVAVSVRDDGIGIAADALPSIFELFEQGPDPRGGGLGIGLALARSLVELHGGRLEARSDGPGQGSEFVVVLPCGDAGADAAEGARHASAPAPLAGGAADLRVLVVDDNRDAADMLAMWLQLGGHVVRVAYSGAEALAAAGDFRPHLALVDIGMPGMDGLVLAREMRSRPWARGLRLAALTGWGRDADRASALGHGFDWHFTKPVDLDALGRLLERLTDRAAAAG